MKDRKSASPQASPTENPGDGPRDIDSDSDGQRRREAKRRVRKHAVRKALTVFLAVVLALSGLGYALFRVMVSRLNRPGGTESADLARYAQNPSAAPRWDVESQGGVMNILLLGIDENADGSNGRSDSNMLVSVDSGSKALRFVSFLRDSYLEIPTMGKNKLNAAYAQGGVALTMQTLVNNYRIGISRYVSVNFSSFAAVIDRMGGLDVPMSAAACSEENANLGTKFREGTNHLNGEQCLYYSRIRNVSDSFGRDDYGRAARQRQVVGLILAKTKSMNLFQSGGILYDYLPYVNTNLSDIELASLASTGASLSSYRTESLQIPAPGTFNDQRDVEGVGRVIDLDLGKNCILLRQFLYGNTSSGQSGG